MVTIQEELKEVQRRVEEMQVKIKDAHLRQERLLGSSNRSVPCCNVHVDHCENLSID